MFEQDKNSNEQVTPKRRDYYLSTVFNLPLGAYKHFKMIFCSTKLNFRTGGNQLPTGIWNYMNKRFNFANVNEEECKNRRYDYLRDPSLFSTQLKDTCFEDSFFQYVLEGLRKEKLANKPPNVEEPIPQESLTTSEKVLKPKASSSSSSTSIEPNIDAEKVIQKNPKLILRNRGEPKGKPEKPLPNKVSNTKSKPKRKGLQSRIRKTAAKTQRQKNLKVRKTRS